MTLIGIHSVLQLAHHGTDSSGHSQQSIEQTPPHQHQHALTLTSANGAAPPHFTPFKRSAQFSIQRRDKMKMNSHSPRFLADSARELMARSKSNPTLLGMDSLTLSFTHSLSLSLSLCPYGSSCDFAAKRGSFRCTLTLHLFLCGLYSDAVCASIRGRKVVFISSPSAV